MKRGDGGFYMRVAEREWKNGVARVMKEDSGVISEIMQFGCCSAEG